MKNLCKNCQNDINRAGKIYCNNQCQADYIFKTYIENWKQGLESGSRGKSAINLSAHVIRYIHQKYNQCCSICGWNELNTYTNRSPLEIEHIDGNSTNNIEENLILLCPNCHSLTKTYKNLNRGHGRLWRREKYVKIGDVPL